MNALYTHKDLGPCNPCPDKGCSICFPELVLTYELRDGLQEAAERFESVLDLFSANFQTPWLAEDKTRLARWRAIIAKVDA